MKLEPRSPAMAATRREGLSSTPSQEPAR
jgi:hypothetical protein